MENPNYERGRVEFFALSDFKKYVYPMLEERKNDLLRKLIDRGSDEDRFAIKEIERLVDMFEDVGTK